MIAPPPKYCPFYCEENIWHLAQAPEFSEVESMVALISSEDRACLFWDQRVCRSDDDPVLWDYHVVLLVQQSDWVVYDLDTTLPFPVDAATYLAYTFRGEGVVPTSYQPRFVLFDAEDYVKDFASNRSHMRGEDGEWLAPPPEWPQIRADREEGFLAFLSQHFGSDAPLALPDLRTRLGLSNS